VIHGAAENFAENVGSAVGSTAALGIGGISFVILGVLAVIVAAFLVTRRFPVNAAVLLILDFILLAAMYGLMDAHFAAVAQIVVYAGAIMIVFVFVIMLLNLPPEELRYGHVTIGESALVIVSLLVAGMLGTDIGRGAISAALQNYSVPAGKQPYFVEEENVRNVSALLFTDYVWAFELVGVLLMIGLIGAVVIAKKRAEHAESA
jgi:NADH-quinone oxidoreductase subunit J